VSEVPSLKAGSDEGPAFTLDGRVADSAELWLVRHGETEWSRLGRHTGRTDLPLTAVGEAQARGLGTLLADVRPVLVLASPRERAQATARIAGLRVDRIDDDLAEWDYGDYEGLRTDEIRERVSDWALWTHAVPNGETIEQVSARADRVLRRAAARLDDGPVILVSHGHIGRVIGARWIGLAARTGGRLALATAAPSRLGAYDGVPVIDRWNMLNPVATEGNAR
jgi:broad specificity phosphatase PhoE